MESGVSPLLRPYLSLLIVVPESKSPVKQDLEEMVREINETQVEEEEVLSDRVYYFSRKENRLFL